MISIPSPIDPSPAIPSTFAASVKSWWATGEKTSAASEERLLRRLPFFRAAGETPVDGPVIATSSQVQLKNPKHSLNMVTLASTEKSLSAPPPAVLMHGYGAGLGFFYLNFPSLAEWARSSKSAVYALDWLGMGRSSRPPFPHISHRKPEDTFKRVTEAETFFVDSLEEWRTLMGLEKMSLIGHSLGAYLSVAYTLKYPERVHKLILLSPAGVPRGPETTQPSRELESPPSPDAGQKGEAEVAGKKDVNKVRSDQEDYKRRTESRRWQIAKYLWEEGWSPFQIARVTSLWAPMLVGKYSSRRFANLGEEDTRDMHQYILNITLAKGSGEYCLSHILAPGAHARIPVVDRISAVKCPVVFVYGDNDWMDPVGGYESVQILRKAGNNQTKMYIIPNAGHHVYLDNHKAVDDMLTKELNRPLK